jgi:hypothetical protein
MAFKLNKQETERLAGFIESLTEASSKIEDAVAVFNDEMEKLKAPVEAALAAYNEILEEASGFAEDIAREADEAIAEKSDNWAEGERGQAAITYKDAWENVDLEQIELAFPDEFTVDDSEIDHAGRLEQLPEAAE